MHAILSFLASSKYFNETSYNCTITAARFSERLFTEISLDFFTLLDFITILKRHDAISSWHGLFSLLLASILPIFYWSLTFSVCIWVSVWQFSVVCTLPLNILWSFWSVSIFHTFLSSQQGFLHFLAFASWIIRFVLFVYFIIMPEYLFIQYLFSFHFSLTFHIFALSIDKIVVCTCFSIFIQSVNFSLECISCNLFASII